MNNYFLPFLMMFFCIFILFSMNNYFLPFLMMLFCIFILFDDDMTDAEAQKALTTYFNQTLEKDKVEIDNYQAIIAEAESKPDLVIPPVTYSAQTIFRDNRNFNVNVSVRFDKDNTFRLYSGARNNNNPSFVSSELGGKYTIKGHAVYIHDFTGDLRLLTKSHVVVFKSLDENQVTMISSTTGNDYQFKAEKP